MKKIILLATTTILSACSVFPQKTVSGTFKGELPCADCQKIQAELVLKNDNTYQYNTVYFKNKEKHPFIEKGTYVWDDKKAGVIRLTEINGISLAFKIDENHAELCNPDGEAGGYKLKKVSP